MSVRFLPEARRELAAAVRWYDTEQPGLGRQFAVEVQATVARITAFPDAFPVFSGRSRRCTTGRFPYGVVYAMSEPGILVVAVMHLHREPTHFVERVDHK